MASGGADLVKVPLRERRPLRQLLVSATVGDVSRTSELVNDAPVELLPTVAAQHRVSGLVLRTMSALDDAPDDVAAQLRSTTAHNALRHLVHVGVLRELADELDAAGIRWLAMKGPVLAARYYQDVDLRGYGDLDLLVDHRDFGEAVRRIERLGFRHEIRNWPLAEEMLAGQVEMKRGPVSLDLHWHLHYGHDDRRPYGFRPTQLIARSRRVDVSGVAVPTFTPVDTVTTLAFHAMRSGGHLLVWSGDLHRVLTVDELDFDEIVEASEAARCAPGTGLMLRRAKQLFGSPVPDEVVERLVPRSLAWVDYVAGQVSHPVALGSSGSVSRFVMRSTRPTAVRSIVDVPARAVRQLVRRIRPPEQHETSDPVEKASFLRAIASAADG